MEKLSRQSLRKQLQTTMIKDRAFFNDLEFKTLTRHAVETVLLTDAHGNLLNFNTPAQKLFGLTKKHFDTPFLKCVQNVDQELAMDYFRLALKTRMKQVSTKVITKNGEIFDAEMTYLPIKNTDTNVQNMLILIKSKAKADQSSEIREVEQGGSSSFSNSIHNESELARMLFEENYENLSFGIRTIDLQSHENNIPSSEIEEISGFSAEFFHQWFFWPTIIHPEDIYMYLMKYIELLQGKTLELQYRIYHRDGSVVWIHDRTIPVKDDKGKILRLVSVVVDISGQRESEQKFRQMYYYDSLTKIPNLVYFNHKIHSLFKMIKGKRQPISIMYVDVDNYHHAVNAVGHKIANELLVRFAKRIQSILPEFSLLAQIRQDVFAIALWGYKEVDYPETQAKAVIDVLINPFVINDFELNITASVGISTYPQDGKTIEDIKKNAEIALHRAKTMERKHYQIYSSNININFYKQYTLEKDLRKSIKNQQLRIFFQPRIESDSGKIVSAEALIRWEHPVWGLVSPNEFIPLAEENGFINDISDWVMKQVCIYLAEWEKENLPVIPISINISAQRFLRSNWKTTVSQIIEETGINPELLELEITERTIIQHEKSIEHAFQFLKEIGVKIALDDFGTGYSSLSYIKDYPIDTIKIDRSFIEQITYSEDVKIIVESLITMAKGLKLNIVAEGVETAEQAEIIKEMEFPETQGFFFSKPIPESQFRPLLKKGYIHPASKLVNPNMKDRRKYPRIQMPFPLSSKMTLVSIQGKRVQLGDTEVLVENISAGGLRFLSNIQLPVRPDIILRFQLQFMDKVYELDGHIVWKNEVKDVFQYGLEFIVKKNDRKMLMEDLNHFSKRLAKDPSVPGCPFVKEDRFGYLLNIETG